jgi:hypothetical protein
MLRDYDRHLKKYTLKLEKIYKQMLLSEERDYDSRLRENSFKAGSLVYKSNTFYRKLDAPWSGPFVIVGILSPVVYKIRDQGRTEVVHHDRMKLYHSSIPDWAQKICSQIRQNSE